MLGLKLIHVSKRGPWCHWSMSMWQHNLTSLVNTLRPGQNGRHFADDIFKCIFLNENIWISIKISLKFVPKGPINNIPALVELMAWRRPGDKPLSEAMMVNLPTNICVSRRQWVNIIQHITQWPSKEPLFSLHSWKMCRYTAELVPFWRLFIFYLLVKSKCGLVGRIYVFSMYCIHYFV